MTVALNPHDAQWYMRMSKPGSSGSIRVNVNGLPHAEHGGR
jgi:hypothetical protein